MKLLELIPFLRRPDTLPELYRQHGMSEEAIAAQEVGLFMAGSLRLDADLWLFDWGTSGDKMRFEKDGTEYEHLLEVDVAVDLLAALDAHDPDMTDLNRAMRLLDYAIYDA